MALLEKRLDSTLVGRSRPLLIVVQRLHDLTNLVIWLESGGMVVIAEAKAQLSQLAARAPRGEEIILSRHGYPIARIVPLQEVVPPSPNRGFGIGRGDSTIPDDSDDPLPDDMQKAFEAR